MQVAILALHDRIRLMNDLHRVSLAGGPPQYLATGLKGWEALKWLDGVEEVKVSRC